jgi:ElaB/YqjD/DUF883 family membrane-anchored ribosome-binding protein
MAFREETKETERKLQTQLAQDIKENVVGLAQRAQDIGNEKAHQVSEYVHEQATNLKLSGSDALQKLENRIKAKPAQSVGIAFAAGILASIILRRRGA